MKRYIEGTMYGDLWMEGRGMIEVEISVPAGISFYEAIEHVVNKTDDFQPRTKRFASNTCVVFETHTYEQRGVRRTSTLVQRRIPFSAIPSLAKYIEVNRNVH